MYRGRRVGDDATSSTPDAVSLRDDSDVRTTLVLVDPHLTEDELPVFTNMNLGTYSEGRIIQTTQRQLASRTTRSAGFDWVRCWPRWTPYSAKARPATIAMLGLIPIFFFLQGDRRYLYDALVNYFAMQPHIRSDFAFCDFVTVRK